MLAFWLQFRFSWNKWNQHGSQVHFRSHSNEITFKKGGCKKKWAVSIATPGDAAVTSKGLMVIKVEIICFSCAHALDKRNLSCAAQDTYMHSETLKSGFCLYLQTYSFLLFTHSHINTHSYEKVAEGRDVPLEETLKWLTINRKPWQHWSMPLVSSPFKFCSNVTWIPHFRWHLKQLIGVLFTVRLMKALHVSVTFGLCKGFKYTMRIWGISESITIWFFHPLNPLSLLSFLSAQAKYTTQLRSRVRDTFIFHSGAFQTSSWPLVESGWSGNFHQQTKCLQATR